MPLVNSEILSGYGHFDITFFQKPNNVLTKNKHKEKKAKLGDLVINFTVTKHPHHKSPFLSHTQITKRLKFRPEPRKEQNISHSHLGIKRILNVTIFSATKQHLN